MDKLTKTYTAGNAQVWSRENEYTGEITWSVDNANTGLTYSRLYTSFPNEAAAIEAADKFAAKEAERAAAATAPAPTTDGSYRTKHSRIYGEGRVYRDQPGATQYRGINGNFDVQIWDES